MRSRTSAGGTELGGDRDAVRPSEFRGDLADGFARRLPRSVDDEIVRPGGSAEQRRSDRSRSVFALPHPRHSRLSISHEPVGVAPGDGSICGARRFAYAEVLFFETYFAQHAISPTLVTTGCGVRELQLRDAKASFSSVVEQAANGDSLVVTRHGRKMAVVLGYDTSSLDRRTAVLCGASAQLSQCGGYAARSGAPS